MFYVWIAVGGLALGAGAVLVIALGEYARDHWSTNRKANR